MPRAHTAEERERIIQRLIDAGREGFVRRGLAKITIADLASAAGIGKGSYYHFYDSKEELFLAIQERDEAAFKESLVRELDAADSGREAVRTLLLTTATRLQQQPFLSLLLEPDTLALLTLRVPPERLAAHREADRKFFTSLFRRWKQRGWIHPHVEPRAVFDTLTAIFLLSTQQALLGPQPMRRAVAELADACAAHWCPE